MLFSRLADVFVYYIEPLIGSNSGRISRKLVYSYFGASNPEELRKNCRSVYLQHYERIRQLAASDPGRLLEFDLESGWKPLCEFLGKEEPQIEFPRINETDALIKVVRFVNLEGGSPVSGGSFQTQLISQHEHAFSLHAFCYGDEAEPPKSSEGQCTPSDGWLVPALL